VINLASTQPKKAQPTPPAAASSMFIMLFTMFMLIAILPFYPAIAAFMGPYIYNAIGFNGKYPVLTIMILAILLGTFTTLLREITTDWKKMAAYQFKMNQWSKAYKKALEEKNTYMIKRLRDVQIELLSEQAVVMKKQQYLYPITMLIIIPMFAGLFGSLSIMSGGSGVLTIRLPWEPNWNLFDVGYLFPNWILFYSGISIIFGTTLTNLINFVRLYPLAKKGGRQ